MELVGRSCWPKQTSFGTPPARENWQLLPFSASQGVPVCPAAGKWVLRTQHECRKPEVFSTKKSVGGQHLGTDGHGGPCHEPKAAPGTTPGFKPSTAPSGGAQGSAKDLRAASGGSGACRASGGAVGRLPTDLPRGVPDPGRSNGPLPGGGTAENSVGRTTEGWIPRRPGGGGPEASPEGGPDLGPSGRQAAA